MFIYKVKYLYTLPIIACNYVDNIGNTSVVKVVFSSNSN